MTASPHPGIRDEVKSWGGTDWAYAALVAFVAAWIYLPRLSEPAAPVWDEAYYLTSAARYLDGTAQFASHPPLGLMLIAAGEAVLAKSRQPTEMMARSKSVAGEDLPAAFDFAAARASSAIFGVLGIVAMFVLLRRLGTGRDAALAVSGFLLFDNASVAQFRAAHLDAFLQFFSIAALAFAASGLRRRTAGADFATGLCGGLAAMVKLSGVLVFAAAAFVILRRIVLTRGLRGLIGGVRDAAIMTAGCLVAVICVLTLHVEISRHRPIAGTPAGGKDLRYVSETYGAYLDGKRPLDSAVVIAAGSDYLRFIRDDFAGVAKVDVNGSSPASWPLGGRAINFRWDSENGETAYVQLLLNPITVMLGLAGLLGGAVALASIPAGGPAARERRSMIAMLMLTYAVFLAAHLYMASQRVMYLYHYLPALTISLALVPLAFDVLAARFSWLAKRGPRLLCLASLAAIAAFLFFSPLTLHRPLTPSGCEGRNAFGHVVTCRP